MTTKNKAKPRTTADWERIEADYRAGTKSLREIAGEHGISHQAVKKRADKGDWTRDLSAKVKAKADALVTRAAVDKAVDRVAKATEAVTVEVEAQVQARIRLEHRRDIGRGRALTMRLFEELEGQTEEQGLVEQLRDALIEEADDNGKRRILDAWQRVASLPGRADTLKKLADSLRVLIDKEREAFGISTAQGAGADGLTLVTVRDFTGRKRQADQ